jgi:hypothetical protein
MSSHIPPYFPAKTHKLSASVGAGLALLGLLVAPASCLVSPEQSDEQVETSAHPFADCESATLRPGQKLEWWAAKGERSSLVSCDKRFELIMQRDGNVVLYQNDKDDRQALWATGTTPWWNMLDSGEDAVMQEDGNFVVYGFNRQALWASDTDHHPGAWLIVQDDGNLVIYGPDDKPLWASNTCCR